MKLNKIIVMLFAVLFLSSCGGTSYSTISRGTDATSGLRFNIKHVRDGCCGCAGILVNSFQTTQLQSQLFLESNEGCPFTRVKLNFHYSPNGTIAATDTLMAVTDSSFTHPLTYIDKLALLKVDSFIAVQDTSLYRIMKIDIKGYRDFTKAEKEKIFPVPAFMGKNALND